MTWSAVRARPVKVELFDLNATGNDVAVEQLEVCHEGLTIKIGQGQRRPDFPAVAHRPTLRP